MDDYPLRKAEKRSEKEFHVAPMVAVSYPEFRYWMRLFTKRAIVWTDMMVANTLVFGTHYSMNLNYEVEHPVVAQVGGNNPEEIYEAACQMVDAGFDEINLNAECPSKLVTTKHQFGAALMKDMDTCVEAMKALRRVTDERGVPTSIKTRIAIDDDDSWDEFLYPFIRRLVDEGGCRRFYMHARKVFTKGLSPLQNRNIPPLDFASVYRLCEAFPDCDFWINGGLRSIKEAKNVCFGVCADDDSQDQPRKPGMDPPLYPAPANLRGCMLARTANEDPVALALLDTLFYGEANNPHKTRREILDKYCAYIEQRYPRRCCDSDPRVTEDYPAPSVAHEVERCEICQDYEIKPNAEDKPKRISSKVYNRALSPVHGVFMNSSGSKAWRKEITFSSGSMVIRNCGPAYGIRRAMFAMSDQSLFDKEFAEPK